MKQREGCPPTPTAHVPTGLSHTVALVGWAEVGSTGPQRDRSHPVNSRSCAWPRKACPGLRMGGGL